MEIKRKLKAINSFVDDNLTPILAKITSELRKRENVGNVLTVDEQIVELMRDNETIMFKSLYKLQKWDNALFCFKKCLKNVIETLEYLTPQFA